AKGRVARYANAQGGWKLAAQAWCIPTCCETVMSIPKNSRALPSVWALNASPCFATRSTTCACSRKTTFASCASFSRYSKNKYAGSTVVYPHDYPHCTVPDAGSADFSRQLLASPGRRHHTVRTIL